MVYVPPFYINPIILKLSQQVSKELGIIAGLKIGNTPIQLRKKNNIRTIQASLAIEGNTLTIEQITYILEGKRVLGPKKDILEVKNALDLYQDLSQFNPLSIKDFLSAHYLLMKKLVSDAGKWRISGVGIFKGKAVAHLPPPADRVSGLMTDLFQFLKNKAEIPWLLKACIFHYELEFIHPFTDGNGRMGRLWQQLLLMKEDKVFEYLPVEEIIRKNQKKYYETLGLCDREGESTKFIEFSLKQILIALQQYSKNAPLHVKDPLARLAYASQNLYQKWFSRKTYLELHKEISGATASRDLQEGLEKKLLEKKGEKNQTLYRFLKLIS